MTRGAIISFLASSDKIYAQVLHVGRRKLVAKPLFGARMIEIPYWVDGRRHGIIENIFPPRLMRCFPFRVQLRKTVVVGLGPSLSQPPTRLQRIWAWTRGGKYKRRRTGANGAYYWRARVLVKGTLYADGVLVPHRRQTRKQAIYIAQYNKLPSWLQTTANRSLTN